MGEPRDLPNINTLLEDTRVDRSHRVLNVLGYLMIIASVGLLLLSAEVAWALRKFSHFPDFVFAVFAASCVLIPVAVGFGSARRVGKDILVLHAVIAPVIVWSVVAIVFAVAGALNGENVF